MIVKPIKGGFRIRNVGFHCSGITVSLHKNIQYRKLLFQKKHCHTYEFPHIYDNVFFRVPAYSLTDLFYSCRLLGLMQTIHTSAVCCCFCRIKCHSSQNCCRNIFLFAACHITHLPFHFYCKYISFCRFFLFNVEIPTQHVIFPHNYFHTDIKIVYLFILPLYTYFIYSFSLLVYFECLCKNDT